VAIHLRKRAATATPATNEVFAVGTRDRKLSAELGTEIPDEVCKDKSENTLSHIAQGLCLPSQRSLRGLSKEHWGDSDVDIVLNHLYGDPQHHIYSQRGVPRHRLVTSGLDLGIGDDPSVGEAGAARGHPAAVTFGKALTFTGTKFASDERLCLVFESKKKSDIVLVRSMSHLHLLPSHNGRLADDHRLLSDRLADDRRLRNHRLADNHRLRNDRLHLIHDSVQRTVQRRWDLLHFFLFLRLLV
jgi:hypothetical protein